MQQLLANDGFTGDAGSDGSAGNDDASSAGGASGASGASGAVIMAIFLLLQQLGFIACFGAIGRKTSILIFFFKATRIN